MGMGRQGKRQGDKGNKLRVIKSLSFINSSTYHLQLIFHSRPTNY